MCVPLPPWAVRAGARETIYHDPKTVNAAIVTCGGLCPGLNDVVQGLVRKLEAYGVPDGNILGIRSDPQSWKAKRKNVSIYTVMRLHGSSVPSLAFACFQLRLSISWRLVSQYCRSMALCFVAFPMIPLFSNG